MGWIGPVAGEGREFCSRCGFTVDFTGSSLKGKERLREYLNDHLAVCPSLPSSGQRREMKRAVRKARFLYGEGAAIEAAEDVLAKIGITDAA